MKIDIQKIESGEASVTVRYVEKTPVINRIIDILENDGAKILGKRDGETVSIEKESILYIESVDDRVFAYTKEEVLRLDLTLAGALETLNDIRFFRCGKSMIINVDRVERLRSLSSNRIDATMEGGEHIIISRTYASDFRKLLKGGGNREEQ